MENNLQNIKAIIFDVGGVITKTHWSQLYTNFANYLGISQNIVINFHKDYLDQMILGEISFQNFIEKVKPDVIKDQSDLNKLKNVWVEESLKLLNLNKPLLEMIDSLRKSYTLMILTNLSESRKFVDEQLGLYSHFDYVFLSYNERLKKPDERFYQLALLKTGFKPEEVIFIDDTEEHVLAANELGIKGIIFRNNNQFKSDLLKLGVNIK